MPKREDLPPLERAVSDALDELLVRMHGVMSSWTHPHEFLDWLRERGYEVVPADEPTRLRERVAELERIAKVNGGLYRSAEDDATAAEDAVARVQDRLRTLEAWAHRELSIYKAQHHVVMSVIEDLRIALGEVAAAPEQRGPRSDALARFRAWLDTDFRQWCSPDGIAARYATDLIEHLDRLVAEEQTGHNAPPASTTDQEA